MTHELVDFIRHINAPTDYTIRVFPLIITMSISPSLSSPSHDELPDLNRFTCWSTSNTQFTKRQISDLQTDFHRFGVSARSLSGEYVLLISKDRFKKHVLKTSQPTSLWPRKQKQHQSTASDKNVHTSHMKLRTRNFLADAIFSFFDDDSDESLNYVQYMGACELLIKGSTNDKTAWLYVMLYNAEKQRQVNNTPHIKPVSIQLPNQLNTFDAESVIDPLLSMRAALGLNSADESKDVEQHTVKQKPRHLSDQHSQHTQPINTMIAGNTNDPTSITTTSSIASPLSLDPDDNSQHARHDDQTVLHTTITNRSNDTEQQSNTDNLQLPSTMSPTHGQSVNDASGLSPSNRSLPPRPPRLRLHERANSMSVSSSATVVNDRNSAVPQSPPSDELATEAKQNYSDVKTFTDLWFGRGHASILTMSFIEFRAMCSRVLDWVDINGESLNIFLPNRDNDLKASTFPAGSMRFTPSELDVLKSMFVRYSRANYNSDMYRARRQSSAALSQPATPQSGYFSISIPSPGNSKKPQSQGFFTRDVSLVSKYESTQYTDATDDSLAFYIDERGLLLLIEDIVGVQSKELCHRVMSAYASDSASDMYAFDIDESLLSFESCVKLLSVLMKGSSREKYYLFFRLCDSDKDGLINREDVQSMLSLALQCSDVPDTAATLIQRQLVDAMFDEFSTLHTNHAMTPALVRRRLHNTSHASYDTQRHLLTFKDLLKAIYRYEFRSRFLWLIRGILTEKQDIQPNRNQSKQNSNMNGSESQSLLDKSTTQTKQSIFSFNRIFNSSYFHGLLLLIVISISLGMYFTGVLVGCVAGQIIDEFNVNPSSIGILGSMPSVGIILGLFTSRYLASSRTLRFAILVNACGQTIGAVLLALAGESRVWSMLLCGFFLFGLCDNGFLVSIAINRHFPATLGFCFSLFASVSSIAVVVASVLLPTVADTYNLTTSFWCTLGIVCISTFAACSYFVIDLVMSKQHASQQPQLLKRLSLHTMLRRVNHLLPFSGTEVRSLLKEIKTLPPPVWLLYANSMLTFGAIATASVFAATYFREAYGATASLGAFIIPGMVNILCM